YPGYGLQERIRGKRISKSDSKLLGLAVTHRDGREPTDFRNPYAHRPIQHGQPGSEDQGSAGAEVDEPAFRDMTFTPVHKLDVGGTRGDRDEQAWGLRGLRPVLRGSCQRLESHADAAGAFDQAHAHADEGMPPRARNPGPPDSPQEPKTQRSLRGAPIVAGPR